MNCGVGPTVRLWANSLQEMPQALGSPDGLWPRCECEIPDKSPGERCPPDTILESVAQVRCLLAAAPPEGSPGHICRIVTGNCETAPAAVGLCTRDSYVHPPRCYGVIDLGHSTCSESMVQLSLISRDHDTPWERGSRMNEVIHTPLQSIQYNYYRCQAESLTSFASTQLGWHSAPQVHLVQLEWAKLW